MGGPGPTIGEDYKVPRIVPPPDRHFSQRVGHVGIDDAADSGGGLLDRDTEWLRDLLPDRGDGGLSVRAHAASKKVIRGDNSEHHVGVRYCSARSSVAVA